MAIILLQNKITEIKIFFFLTSNPNSKPKTISFMLPKIKTFFTQKKKKNQTFFFDKYESICLSVLLIKTRIFCMKKLIKLSFPFLNLWLCVYEEINHVFEIAENSRFLNTMNLSLFKYTNENTHLCLLSKFLFDERNILHNNDQNTK